MSEARSEVTYVSGLMGPGSGISVSWAKGESVRAHILEFRDEDGAHWGLVWECPHRHRVLNDKCWTEASMEATKYAD